MLTVACVLKPGGIYDATWVARLKAGVAKHLPIEHRFVCLSDVDVPCERIPLEHDWPGWWSKIELFKLPGPVLFFDLDTAIVGDLTDIAHRATIPNFMMLRDFYRANGLGSGVMSWNATHPPRWLYDQFAVRPAAYMVEHMRGGDQAFIESQVNVWAIFTWQNQLPGQIVSYKVHCRSGIPPNARVVCLHGHPKFAEMPSADAVRVAWEKAA